MDVQMTISVLATNTPFTGRTAPIMICRTNLLPFSYAALQDPELINDLEPFGTLHKQGLDLTFLTSYLLYFLLTYRASWKPKESALIWVSHAIKILEAAWETDIKQWSQSKSFTPEDLRTGEVIWNNYFVQFVHLILQPLQTRPAYISFNEKGDIVQEGHDFTTWRRCIFDSFLLNRITKTFELQFQVNTQKRGLILQINDIKNFEKSGIHFQHPTHPECVLMNPFSCEEFARPSYDADQVMKRILTETWISSARSQRAQNADDAEGRILVESPHVTIAEPTNKSPEVIIETSEQCLDK